MATGVVRPMKRGDTLQFTVQVFQSPPFQNAPQNITGWFSWFTAKYTTADPDPSAVMAVTSGNGGIVYPMPLAGILMVTVPPGATVTLADGELTLPYDVQVQDLAGNIFTVEDGTLDITADVTRAINQSPPVPVVPFNAIFEQFVSVVNPAVLSALNAAAMPDGSVAYVASVARYFQLQSLNASVVDGVLVLSANPGGRWLRLALVPG